MIYQVVCLGIQNNSLLKLLYFNKMVTFVCSYCDATLKKKQTEKHSFGRCRPASFICIDCHVTFQGDDYKKHISCLTEFEKHWGDYAKPKQITQNPQNGQNGKEQKTPQQPKLLQVTEKPNGGNKKQEQNSQTSWKGWKNELKNIIKDSSNSITMDALQSKAIKRYRDVCKQDDKDEQLMQLVKEKVGKLKKVKLTTYVTLE